MADYDLIIVGAGASGLTAGIYAGRKGLKTLIVSVDVGGLTNLTNHIENYPGVEPQPGFQLMQKFLEQAQRFGAELITNKVLRIEKEEHSKNIDAKLPPSIKNNPIAAIISKNNARKVILFLMFTPFSIKNHSNNYWIILLESF